MRNGDSSFAENGVSGRKAAPRSVDARPETNVSSWAMRGGGSWGTVRRAAPNVLVLAVSVALSLVAAELLLRVLLPAPTEYRALVPGLEATFETGYVTGVQGPSLYNVNSMGVRGREWGPDRGSEYRVLCLGGSATECLITDQRRVWTSLLEQRLGRRPDGGQSWVGNIGRSGLNTRHHVLQMRRLLGVYDPDAVVLLAGVNDLSSRLRQGDSGEPLSPQGPENQSALTRQAFAVHPGRFGSEWADDPWLKRTRLWLLLRHVKYQVLKQPEDQDQEGLYLRRWRALRAAGGRVARLPPLGPALDEHARNLREIVRLGRAHGASVLLVTQPALWRAGLTEDEKALLWMGGVGEFRSRPGAVYFEPEALAGGLDAYNERMLEVCRDLGAACLDLGAAVPRTTEYFWDDCHLTDKAQVLVADLVAEALTRESP